MAGTALEVAIALWRMPAMRTALRQRPLPDGVAEVIGLVAGNPARVARAAERLEERPAEILEAARFYVREVLLSDDGDAYRVLGLAPGARQDQIKAHHRALQHWLHPDRRGDDWDSVYAARINTAWSALRSPERRARYDARAQAVSPAEPPRQRRLVTRWQPGPGAVPAWRRLAIPVLALMACAWLLVLAGRQANSPPPEWSAEGEMPADPALAGLRSAAAAAVPGVASEWQVGAAGAGPPAAASPTPAAAARADRRDVPAARHLSTDPAVPVGAMDVAPVPPPRAPAPMAADAAPAHGSPASPREPGGALPSARRVLLAEAAARDVTGYLRGDVGVAPPVWGSLAALDTAEVLRMRLGAIDPRGTGSVRFGPPRWRITSSHATMTADIEAGSPGAAGTLEVDLAWRDGMWLVEALNTEPKQ